MSYYVIGDDGQKYGPADIATLQSWIGEGRLLPNQQVEEEGSGIRMAASAVNDLKFPGPAVPQGPSGSPQQSPQGTVYQGAYVRPDYAGSSGDNGQSDVTLAWVLGVFGLFCCFTEPVALFFAYRAVGKGHPGGKAVLITCWILMAVVILAVIWKVNAVMGMMNSGKLPVPGQFPTK